MKKEVTKNQIKIIWTIVRKYGIGEDEYREWLLRTMGKRQTRQLTESEADEVIRLLKIFIGQEYREYRRSWGMTTRQRYYAKRLAYQIGWDDPKRLDGLVKKMFYGKPRMELLNKAEGTKLILALEKMAQEVERGEKVYA
jgi:hypothetical protein